MFVLTPAGGVMYKKFGDKPNYEDVILSAELSDSSHKKGVGREDALKKLRDHFKMGAVLRKQNSQGEWFFQEL
jgi:hypothetical protein